MRIAFLNSCLEPGRDGVGDYTRSLAQQCIRQGHDCRLVALNDRHVSEPTVTENDGLSELRLPSTLPWPQRVAHASAFLDAFAPDWVSLQFVPYGFHPKGFVHGMGRHLQPLVAGRRVHIMFHELWIGEAGESSLKDRLIGTAQRQLLHNLVRQLRPTVITTSNEVYLARLQRLHLAVSLLPLFGSIPVSADTNIEWLYEAMKAADLEVNSKNRFGFLLIGFFGAIYREWSADPLFSMLRQVAQQSNKRLVLLSAGRIGNGKRLWADLSARRDSGLTFVKLGELPAHRISQYLQFIDYGVATSSSDIVEKSSTVVAMLEHGLPVIVSRVVEGTVHGKSLGLGVFRREPLLLNLNDRLVKKMINGVERGNIQPRLTGIASEFLSLLRLTSASIMS